MSQDNTNFGRDQNIFNNPQSVAVYKPQEQPRDPVLKTLLGSVQQEVNERLAQSLHRAVDVTLLNLGKALEPHQVRSQWTMKMSVQELPPQPLPPEMTIAQVFELPKVEQKLLILGEPGSGKTTTLLELTQTLVERALENTNTPIPVLVNLSSWKDPQQKIFDWLLEELESKYGLRQELGRQFFRQNQLMPCLDGLDEVAPIRQEACAVELNDWLTGNAEHRSMGVVVCCRREEYENIVRKRLFLENSVALQPLSNAQIEAYLNQFRLGAVWESVQVSPQLQDLLRKPLFLAVFGFVAPRFDFEKWQRMATDDERMEYLFDCYWDVAMDRALVDTLSQENGMLSKTYVKRKLPDRKGVRRALVFAAKAMEQESQTELIIEKIQPNWLRNKHQRSLFILIDSFFELLLAGLIGSLACELIGVQIIISGLPIGIIVFMLIEYNGILLSFIDLKKLSLDIYISISYRLKHDVFCSPRRQIIASFIQAIVVGIFTGFIDGLIFGLFFGLMLGFNFGLTIGILFVLISIIVHGQYNWLKADIGDYIIPNQVSKIFRQNILTMIPVSLLLVFFIKILLEQLPPNILLKTEIQEIFAITVITLFWTSFCFVRGRSLISHIALRIVLVLNSYAPYRYDKLLDYCTERLLLQRIGGRYRFMHKLLQEHFAKMPLD